jgi:hypothetical protein
MAVRLRVRVARKAGAQTKTLETVAVANSGFESDRPEVLLPARAAARIGLWPPPRGARTERFESPAASFELVAVPQGVRVTVSGNRKSVSCSAVLSERETEVVLNDQLLEALGVEIIAPATGLYRIGARGALRRSDAPESW